MRLRKPIANVTLFSGKGFDFRSEMMYYLAMNKESTTWDIAQFISKDEIRQEPSRKSMITKSHYGGVLKNISKLMVPQKYVIQIGTRTSKGNPSPTYGLSFRGSLIVLALPLNNMDFQNIVKKNINVNPFYKLIVTLETNGMYPKLCTKVLLNSLINGVKNNLINLTTDNESIIGQSIIPSLAIHLTTLKKSELKKFVNILSGIENKKDADNPPTGLEMLSNALEAISTMMISPLFWSEWSKNEDAQLMTLYFLINMTLNPKEYEKLFDDSASDPEYDESLSVDVKT